ncbi:hypothetical protein IEK_02896 [Bacillus toyonensis]|uniref:DUF3942 family protein n=1 Tax=Bacillus toyonensis TaxID=155322 RepID=UPI00027BEB68|nr:DUF3942 family protein [Bacillus toyonensis]EJV49186.1 hypothetical protein IEK_02896 [Bacillus toyonensis]
MSSLEQFIERVKEVVTADVQEKILREKYNQVILPCMKKIEESLKRIDGYDYSISILKEHSELRIHNINFNVRVDEGTNTIEVKTITDTFIHEELDRIVLQEGKLFSKKREEIFTEDILVEFLNEAFAEILVQ